MSRPCVRCEKGVGIFLCSGCQDSFCRKHSDEHRQDLFGQLDEVILKFDGFQQNLLDPNGENSLMKRIDQWEIESIDRIRQSAAKAREDLQKSIERIQVELNPMKNEIKEMRQTESFTELDLNRWIDQLKLQQKYFETIMNDWLPSHEEKFVETNEFVELFEDRRVAQSRGKIGETLFPIFGTIFYSKGVHFRRFRIEKLVRRFISIGITSVTEENGETFKYSNSFHGLVSGTIRIKEPTILSKFIKQTIDMGDEIDLTINCDRSQLIFQKTTSDERLELLVNQISCPLPWKITLVLFGQGNQVRIVR